MNRKKQILWMAVFFVMIWPALLFAGEVDLPKTGQTTCYDEQGNVIDCADTGQDGDIRAGVQWPEPRFEDNGDGTVIDHLTGLIWLKNADCGGAMNWNAALTYCNNLASGSCGLTDGSVAGDWRLPNVVELESLVNAEEPVPCLWLNTQGFIDVYPYKYWSATNSAYNSSYAWIVYMSNGGVGSNGKAGSLYVWPVRAGQ